MTQIAQGAHVYLFPEPGQVYRVQADDVATVQVLYGAPSAVITLTAQSQTFGPYDSPAKLKVTANTAPAEYTLIRAHYAELTPEQIAGGAVGVLGSNNAGGVVEPDGDVPTLGGGSSVTVINDLTTGGATAALSAEMGKSLHNGKMDNALPAMSAAFSAGTESGKEAFRSSVSEGPFVPLQRYASHVVNGDWAPALAQLFADYALSGARVMIPLGTTVLKSWPLIPTNSDAAPKQAPFSFVGSGPHWSGRGSAPYGASILDLQISDPRGKIKTNGLGFLGFNGITITDSTAQSGALIYTTNTTLGVEWCCFYGQNGTALTSAQDAIILGGPNQIEAGGGWDDGFQGYGTAIRNNYFSRIRRGVWGRAFANANVVAENTFWSNCGGATSDFAAIEFDCGTSGGVQYDTGNYIVGNLIEATNYVYCIKLGRASGNYVAGNPIYDAHTGHSLAGVYCGPDAITNTIIGSYCPGNIEPVIDEAPAAFPNFIINTLQSKYSKFGPTRFPDTNYDTEFYRALFYGGDGTFKRRPAAALPGTGSTLFSVERSLAEASDPGGVVFAVRNGGNIAMRYAEFQVNGNKWVSIGSAGTGQNMTWDSGPGGSYNDIRGYAVRHYDHTGQLMLRGGAGKYGLSYGPALDASWERHASAPIMIGNTPIRSGEYTAATLPTPSATYRGARAHITDATASPSYMATVSGGGSSTVPVLCTGSAWIFA